MCDCGKLSSLLQKFYSLQVYFDVIEEIDCIIDKHVCMEHAMICVVNRVSHLYCIPQINLKSSLTSFFCVIGYSVHH